MNKKAILYTRVSTDEQAIHGYSLRDQHEKLKAYCFMHDIEPVAHFQDDHSAKSFDRPEFNKLLEYIRNHKNYANLILFIKWDRFSRNAPESYEMLGRLKKLKVEAQAIEQPLDLDVPENKIMLAIYLTSPEVENDRRSLNTSYGMRRAIKEGRWVASAPKGYDNKRDENNKPVIVPNNDARFIIQAFQGIKSGEISQQDLRRNLKNQGFVCSKSNFSNLLRNPVYMGMIRLKANKSENESIVKGLHKPIISEEDFYAVQDILNGRNGRKSGVEQNKIKPELPLRGFLKCPRCGRTMTGSASKGNGGRYFYYHCTFECRERVKANFANEKFVEWLKEFQPRSDLKDLFDALFDNLLQEEYTDSKGNKSIIEEEINKVQKRLENLQDKLADNLIEISDYNSTRQRYVSQLRELNDKKAGMTYNRKGIQEQILFCYPFFENLPSFYVESAPYLKQRIIGSIFPEKILFSGNYFRTTRINVVAELIRSINKPFDRNKNGQFCEKSKLSCMVAPTGIEPVFKV